MSFEHDADGRCYEVRLMGHVDTRWAAWFEGMDITLDDDGTTLLRGPLTDQAALHGVLHRVRDIGLPLLSVHVVAPAPEMARTIGNPFRD